MNITINVNAPRQQTEAERFTEASNGLERMIVRAINNKIANEKTRGNPLFLNVDTYEKYRAAIDAEDKQRRVKRGFWKFIFG